MHLKIEPRNWKLVEIWPAKAYVVSLGGSLPSDYLIYFGGVYCMYYNLIKNLSRVCHFMVMVFHKVTTTMNAITKG
jgi:hypothetical protein